MTQKSHTIPWYSKRPRHPQTTAQKTFRTTPQISAEMVSDGFKAMKFLRLSKPNVFKLSKTGSSLEEQLVKRLIFSRLTTSVSKEMKRLKERMLPNMSALLCPKNITNNDDHTRLECLCLNDH